MTGTDLSVPEHEMLADAEQVIERGLRTFVEVGNALLQIRDGRLYRQTHTSFEAYCADRWQFTDRRARQLIDAAVTVMAIEQTGTTVPTSERAVRELAGLSACEAAAVIGTAVANTGTTTSKAIRDAREQVTKQPLAGHQRPLLDVYGDAVREMLKAANRVGALHRDDRFLDQRSALHDRFRSFVGAASAGTASIALDLMGVNTCSKCCERVMPSAHYDTCEKCRAVA